MLGETVAESHGSARAASVKECPRDARRVDFGDHRQDRGDADAAGDEQVPPGRPQREMVARSAYTYRRAFEELVVDERRAAAPGGLALDGDPPPAAIRRVPAQR